MTGDVYREVIEEAVETVMAEDYVAEGGVEYAASRCSSARSAARKAEDIINRLAGTIERRPFEFLRRTPAEQIAAFLRQRVAADASRS